MVFQGKFKAPVFVSFLQRLLKEVAGKIYLIVDGHPMHKACLANHFSPEHSGQHILSMLPPVAAIKRPGSHRSRAFYFRFRNGRTACTRRRCACTGLP